MENIFLFFTFQHVHVFYFRLNYLGLWQSNVLDEIIIISLVTKEKCRATKGSVIYLASNIVLCSMVFKKKKKSVLVFPVLNPFGLVSLQKGKKSFVFSFSHHLL